MIVNVISTKKFDRWISFIIMQDKTSLLLFTQQRYYDMM